MVLFAKKCRGLILAFAFIGVNAWAECCCLYLITPDLIMLDEYLSELMADEASPLGEIADRLEEDEEEIKKRTEELRGSQSGELSERKIGGSTLYEASVKVRKAHLYYKIINTAGFEKWGDDLQLLGSAEAQSTKSEIVKTEILYEDVSQKVSDSISNDAETYKATRRR